MSETARQERIRWLAELSAARRALRAAGWSAAEAIAAQLRTSRIRRFSAFAQGEVRRAELIDLFQLQGGVCYLCPAPMRARNGHQTRDDATRDHVVPKRRKGRDVGNILAAHRSCNEAKGDRAPYPCELIYLEAVNARLAQYSAPARTRSA